MLININRDYFIDANKLKTISKAVQKMHICYYHIRIINKHELPDLRIILFIQYY